MKYVNWVLVPIDFSKESRLALELADRQTACWNAGLILLHVRKPREAIQTRLTIGKSAVEKWGRYVTHTAPDRVAYLTCVGEPVDEILRIAEQFRPRKIVMGRGGTKWQAGSVTQAVGAGFPGIVEAVSALHEDIFIHARTAQETLLQDGKEVGHERNIARVGPGRFFKGVAGGSGMGAGCNSK